ncbi:MAG: NAD(P)-dependent oxidoreductase, partial [Planctomycetes bacterium]|nr:NAD(P)-dependent oxidoreductase [Planctomycetota bacterium]
MNIVVFGAGGWVGRAVLADLAGKHQIRAVLRGPESWEKYRSVDGEWRGGEIIYGNIEDFAFTHKVTEGMDGIIHLTVYFPTGDDNDALPFLI